MNTEKQENIVQEFTENHLTKVPNIAKLDDIKDLLNELTEYLIFIRHFQLLLMNMLKISYLY